MFGGIALTHGGITFNLGIVFGGIALSHGGITLNINGLNHGQDHWLVVEESGFSPVD